jgi:hypothetical protein
MKSNKATGTKTIYDLRPPKPTSQELRTFLILNALSDVNILGYLDAHKLISKKEVEIIILLSKYYGNHLNKQIDRLPKGRSNPK